MSGEYDLEDYFEKEIDTLLKIVSTKLINAGIPFIFTATVVKGKNDISKCTSYVNNPKETHCNMVEKIYSLIDSFVNKESNSEDIPKKVDFDNLPIEIKKVVVSEIIKEIEEKEHSDKTKH